MASPTRGSWSKEDEYSYSSLLLFLYPCPSLYPCSSGRPLSVAAFSLALALTHLHDHLLDIRSQLVDVLSRRTADSGNLFDVREPPQVLLLHRCNCFANVSEGKVFCQFFSELSRCFSFPLSLPYSLSLSLSLFVPLSFLFLLLFCLIHLIYSSYSLVQIGSSKWVPTKSTGASFARAWRDCNQYSTRDLNDKGRSIRYFQSTFFFFFFVSLSLSVTYSPSGFAIFHART